MDILTLGNELLRGKAEPVGKIDDELKQIADEMLMPCIREKVSGLPAPRWGL